MVVTFDTTYAEGIHALSILPKDFWTAIGINDGSPAGAERLVESVGKTAAKAVLEPTHFTLDILGMAPVFGEVADGINGSIYALEGRYAEAALSYAATIPFVGWFSIGGKWAYKIAKPSEQLVHVTVAKVDDLIQNGHRVLAGSHDGLKEAAKGLGEISMKGEQPLTYMQARGLTLEIFKECQDKSVPNIGRLETSYGYGKVVGRKSEDGLMR